MHTRPALAIGRNAPWTPLRLLVFPSSDHFLSFFFGVTVALGCRISHSFTSASSLRRLVHIAKLLPVSCWFTCTLLTTRLLSHLRVLLSPSSLLSVDLSDARGCPIEDLLRAHHRLNALAVARSRRCPAYLSILHIHKIKLGPALLRLSFSSNPLRIPGVMPSRQIRTTVALVTHPRETYE